MAEDKKIFPWGLHPMSDWITEEFSRRTQEVNLNPVTSTEGTRNVYSGPRTAWARVFSNGISGLAPDLQGFVMGGTDGFDQSYGFTADKKVTIGVDAFGKKHSVNANGDWSYSRPDNPNKTRTDFPHRPPPSLVSVETEFAGGGNSSFNALCRKTKITWKCYSLNQLEYMTPYFLTPRITCLVEWGWNNYDTVSLVDLTDIEWLYGIFEGKEEYTIDWIKASNGNYDLAMGFITDYGYTLNSAGGYDCYTVITNANYLIEGLSYQNAQSSKKDPADSKKTIQLKDFTEFVFKDMDNLEIKNKTKDKKETAEILKIKTTGKIFRDGDEMWMKMDLVKDIINTFFKRKFLDKDGKEVNVGISELDIKDVPICAHPALKSTNKNILIPNQFAPRFVTKDPKTKAQNSLKGKSVGTGEYFTLFPDIEKLVRENNFEDSYDDIRSVINKSGRSFPMYKKYDGGDNRGAPAGYWGYLEDVYVSAKLFKGLVQKNETVLKLIEELLQHISEALCNISQLQCRPSTLSSSIYTVYDTSFSPIRTVKDAASLPRITIGSVNSAFLRSADFSVKLSGEMANQMVMQSASGRELPDGFGTMNLDPKSMKVSRFAKGDRMFERGVLPPDKITDSDNKKPSESKYKRKFTPENKQEFYVYKHGSGKDAAYRILAEQNQSFLKNILMDTKDKRTMYNNNGLMPGTNFTMELLGIGGITFLSQFTLDHVPNSYNYENAVWQVSDVKQKVENKTWTTTVVAQARPLTSIE